MVYLSNICRYKKVIEVVVGLNFPYKLLSSHSVPPLANAINILQVFIYEPVKYSYFSKQLKPPSPVLSNSTC